MNLIAFSQAKKDSCTYQPPVISCEQAQEDANAIVLYPLALESLAEKDELIRLKESELNKLKNYWKNQKFIDEIEKQKVSIKLEKAIKSKNTFKSIASFLVLCLTGTIILK